MFSESFNGGVSINISSAYWTVFLEQSKHDFALNVRYINTGLYKCKISIVSQLVRTLYSSTKSAVFGRMELVRLEANSFFVVVGRYSSFESVVARTLPQALCGLSLY